MLLWQIWRIQFAYSIERSWYFTPFTCWHHVPGISKLRQFFSYTFIAPKGMPLVTRVTLDGEIEINLNIPWNYYFYSLAGGFLLCPNCCHAVEIQKLNPIWKMWREYCHFVTHNNMDNDTRVTNWAPHHSHYGLSWFKLNLLERFPVEKK